MKKKIFSILRFIPAIAMMCIIFIYSDMPADESAQVSDTLVEKIIIITEHISGRTIQYSTAEYMCYAIRKIAHFSEYAFLAITVCFAFLRKYPVKKKLVFLCWLISAVYAASDEIHQLFVPGRNANLTDVFIDSCGAFFGIIVFLLFYNFRHMKEKQAAGQ